MKKSCLLGAVCACLIFLSFSANAVIVSVDWKTPGDNLITRDTDTGFEWLDLTATVNMSHDDVTAQLGIGGSFEGWSYATRTQISGFWDAFGGDSQHYAGWASQNDGLFDRIAPLWGDLHCLAYNCAVGEGHSYIITGDLPSHGKVWVSLAYDLANDSGSAVADQFNLSFVEFFHDSVGVLSGSALIRTSAVPLPAAAWLFGTGLLGLVGMARKKAA